MISLPQFSLSGFDVVPAVLDRSELAGIVETLGVETLDRSRAGARHLMRHPIVVRLAHDRRLLSIARGFLGAEPIPFRVTLFDKSPQNNWLVVWHQDTALPLKQRHDVPGWGPWSVNAGIAYAHAPASALERVIALRLHIDDSYADNGPLRVLPDTHMLGVLTDEEIGRVSRDVPAIDCVVPAGGIVAMRPLLVHSSSKSETDLPRRVLHIEYADSVMVGDGLDLAIA